MCPHCDNIMRLSDLHIRSTSKTTKTWLDDYDLQKQTIQEKEEKFGESKEELRKKAVERGRAKVLALIKKSMANQFAKLNYDPYDIKPILHPVDFTVFDGMNQNKMKDVILLARKTTNPILKNHHEAISNVIKTKSYDWKVVRVSIDGQIEFE